MESNEVRKTEHRPVVVDVDDEASNEAYYDLTPDEIELQRASAAYYERRMADRINDPTGDWWIVCSRLEKLPPMPCLLLPISITGGVR
jgi:hypothetical protein